MTAADFTPERIAEMRAYGKCYSKQGEVVVLVEHYDWLDIIDTVEALQAENTRLRLDVLGELTSLSEELGLYDEDYG